MKKPVRPVLDALRNAAEEVADHIGPVGRPFWEFTTNIGPALIAIVLWWGHQREFEIVWISVGFAAGAVLLATLPVWLNSRESLRDAARPAERMQPVFDKLSWVLMAVVLLLSAVDAASRAFYDEGVSGIASPDYRLWNSRWTFSELDIYSLTFGLVTIVSPIFLEWLARAGKVTKERNLTHFALAALPFVLAAAWLSSRYLMKVAIEAQACQPGHATAMIAGVERCVAVPSLQALTDGQLELAAVGIVLFLINYLGRHRTLVEMLGCKCHADEHTPEQSVQGSTSDSTATQQDVDAALDDELLWAKTLRALVFETVVLPPLIVSAALVSSTLDEATAAVYGVFVYSGFSVWNLSAKVVKGAKSRFRGLIAVLILLIQGLFLTVLWSIALANLGAAVDPEKFDAVLRIALAAIFVQVVFGPVYQNAWGRTLSDRWMLEGPEYVVVATMICVALGAMHPDDGKWAWALGIVAVMVFAPAWALRRTLVAYILMRVQPGRTPHVRKTLAASEIQSAVVYGDYDLLAKIEVPGKLRFFARRADVDSRNLGVLAALVKSVVRKGRAGVIETQTLLDFSDFVPIPSMDEPKVKRSRARGGESKAAMYTDSDAKYAEGYYGA
ncbi:membrane hypothetical protein [Paraburkholderia tropica]|uniref:hypothetical protein n=1 Tax=Paraburkholderia tropica TaxID=92647 RepID=UPI001CAF09F1|nr:hypothetical protein [Paraburkholderia tropica]CAG9216331.1 membrane hypothetical protein [Paraburkholderia tropica]